MFTPYGILFTLRGAGAALEKHPTWREKGNRRMVVGAEDRMSHRENREQVVFCVGRLVVDGSKPKKMEGGWRFMDETTG